MDSANDLRSPCRSVMSETTVHVIVSCRICGVSCRICGVPCRIATVPCRIVTVSFSGGHDAQVLTEFFPKTNLKDLVLLHKINWPVDVGLLCFLLR